MKKLLAILFALAICASRAQGQFMPMQTTGGFLRLVQTIPLPTDGYMDHLAADVKGQRLFICGEASKGLVTVDLRAGKVIHFTQGLPAMPKKPFYLADSNEIWVTMTDSTVVAFSGTTYEPIKTVRLSEFGNPKAGADNAAYDPNAHLLYAGVEVFSEGTNDRPTPMALATAAATTTCRPVPRSTWWIPRRRDWWAPSNCRVATRRASPSSPQERDCM
jgi:hypothetical protein